MDGVHVPFISIMGISPSISGLPESTGKILVVGRKNCRAGICPILLAALWWSSFWPSWQDAFAGFDSIAEDTALVSIQLFIGIVPFLSGWAMSIVPLKYKGRYIYHFVKDVIRSGDPDADARHGQLRHNFDRLSQSN